MNEKDREAKQYVERYKVENKVETDGYNITADDLQEAYKAGWHDAMLHLYKMPLGNLRDVIIYKEVCLPHIRNFAFLD